MLLLLVLAMGLPQRSSQRIDASNSVSVVAVVGGVDIDELAVDEDSVKFRPSHTRSRSKLDFTLLLPDCCCFEWAFSLACLKMPFSVLNIQTRQILATITGGYLIRHIYLRFYIECRWLYLNERKTVISHLSLKFIKIER